MTIQFGTIRTGYNRTEYPTTLPISYTSADTYIPLCSVGWWCTSIAVYPISKSKISLYVVDHGGNTGTTGIYWLVIGY